MTNLLHPIVLDVINGALSDLGLPALRMKKTRTHDGEWYGMCPRCYMLRGDGGEDRFIVWPNSAERPVEGWPATDDTPASKPVFMCRRCKRENGNDWSGDLVQFCQDVIGLPYHQARKFLGLPPKKFDKNAVQKVKLAPSRDRKKPPLPPSDIWQSTFFDLLVRWQEVLWSLEGEGALWYLRDRGLSDDTIKRERYGYNDEDFYFDASEVGLKGKIHIPVGIVIPEFHYNLVTGEEEIWSLAVRFSDEDVELEYALTGKKHKYEFVSGSQTGLFLDYTLDPDKLCMMVEGQIDAHSIKQEAGDLISVVATLGKKNGRHIHYVNMLNLLSKGVLIVVDVGDNETTTLADYWLEELDTAFVEPPLAHDANEMLQQGPGTIRKWILALLEKYAKWGIIDGSSGVPAQNSVEIPLSPNTPPVEPVTPQKRKVVLDPLTEEKLQEMATSSKSAFSLKSSPVDIEIMSDIVSEQTEAVSLKLDPVLTNCSACENPAKYSDVFVRDSWCEKHVSAILLLEQGQKINWQELVVLGGYGLVDANLHTWTNELLDGGNPGPGWKWSDGAYVPASQEAWRQFCREAPLEDIWIAARYARDIAMGFPIKDSLVNEVKRFIQPIKHRCANCGRNADKPVKLFPEPPKKYNGVDIEVAYEDKSYDGFVTWQGTPDELRWCARCIPCHNFLKEMEEWEFPGFEYGSISVPSGKQAAIDFVLDKGDREPHLQTVRVNYALDTFKWFYIPAVFKTEKRNVILVLPEQEE